MTDVEMKLEVEEFAEELSDEALDREGNSAASGYSTVQQTTFSSH